MSENVTHQMMMLRPLQAGLSGYARLQGEAGRQLVQINLRGMQSGEMRVFWYAGEGLVREVGRSSANARGEATLSAEIPMDAAAPRRLMALLITDGGDRPRPLAIGLCTAQSAGSLMDAKNALLALCDKLGRLNEQKSAAQAAEAAQKQPSEDGCSIRSTIKATDTTGSKGVRHQDAETTKGKPVKEKMAPDPASPSVCRKKDRHSPDRTDLPREDFLPAIEARTRPERRRIHRRGMQPECGSVRETTIIPAAPEALPQESPPLSQQPVPVGSSATPESPPPAPFSCQTQGTPLEKPKPTGLPADRLPALHWPAPFHSLTAYFDRCLPVGLMNWPGWRFVHVPQSRLWIGYHQQDGRVKQVAYALPADAQVPDGQPFRPARTASGDEIQLLVLDA